MSNKSIALLNRSSARS